MDKIMNPKVTVILPSLNVIKYIDRCIKSVCCQTLQDIEILCIDAGSVDGTAEYLEKCKENDRRIKIIHSSKKSYGYQMNLGIRQARGEYIGIVETDDFVCPDMFQTLYEKAGKYEVDFVKADYLGVYNDNEYEKTQYYSILLNDKLYNIPLKCEYKKEVFLHNMTATWSGIYRKDFLIKNGIYHNETLGASFQDTGFWFQTYMEAEKALFIPFPLYRYRIDNPNSSTFDSTKIFCICDEFYFVLQEMEKRNKSEKFKDVFCWIFFRKYYRNLERIEQRDIKTFLKKFSLDFINLKTKEIFDDSLFSCEERKALYDICTLKDMYFDKILLERKAFVQKLLPYEKIIIYGAGKIGKKIYKEYKKIAENNKIEVAVTQKDNNLFFEDDIEIKEIFELIEYKEKAVVVLAVLDASVRKKMEETASGLGFENILKLPFGLWNF